MTAGPGPGADGIYPGAPEIPGDGVDQDCDGVDDCYVDLDGDGYGGTTAVAGAGLDCDAFPDTTSNGEDCDDLSADAAFHYPGAPEIVADGIDQDCDGADACYVDFDGDRYGSPTTVAGWHGLRHDPGTADNADDCDDYGVLAGTIYPNAPEVPGDSVDQNCDGLDAASSTKTEMAGVRTRS